MKLRNCIALACTFLLLACSEGDDLVENQVNEVSASQFFKEDFESFPFYDVPKWRLDTATYDGPYSESGEYFQQKKIITPIASRNTIAIGKDDWLVAEVYTRTKEPIILAALLAE
jgi:hypothetical protein